MTEQLFDTKVEWVPEPPPELLPGEAVGLDYEYKPGPNPTRDKPFSLGVYSPARRKGWYLPWAHKGGGNLDEAVVKRWFQEQMYDRDFYSVNAKAEVHQSLNWGLDADRLRPHDVAYYAALLNENRYSGFSLESLIMEYGPEDERKIKPFGIDPKLFGDVHAGLIAPRCIADARQHWLLWEAMKPLMEADDLMRVADLEDSIIPAVVEMERNGALIDRSLLESWTWELESWLEKEISWVHQELGLPINLALPWGQETMEKPWSPDARKDMIKLFNKLGIPLEKARAFDEYKKEWVQNFSDEALEGIDHPTIQRVRKIKQWASIKSKYFDKYLGALDGNNVMRFILHQLRSDSTGEDKGTTTGRFSCGGDRPGEPKRNINIQQVPKCEDQIERLGERMVVRELFIPQKGKLMGASDASQIEFRLFAHYGKARSVIEAYKVDPMEDFHMLVTRMMKPEITDPKLLKAERKHMKHNNFGVIYGMGREKLARRLGHPCHCDINWRLRDERNRLENKFWDNSFHEDGCAARKANDIMDEYQEKFPEAKELLEAASKRAKEVGYVRTLYGRRRRFPDGQSLHKALNAVIQGSAADIFKHKLWVLYQHRKKLGLTLRMPVHDEFVYDVPGLEQANQVQELLDRQDFQLSVPILWDSAVGTNWKVANLPKLGGVKIEGRYK